MSTLPKPRPAADLVTPGVASPIAAGPPAPFWIAALGAPRGSFLQRLAGFVAFAAVTSLPYLVLPRTWVTLGRVVERAVGESNALRLLLEDTASIPGRLLAFHALALLAYWLPGTWRLRAAAVGALAIGLGLQIIDLPSVLALGVVAALMWQVFRLPIPRWTMLIAVVAAPLGLRALGDHYGWQALDRAGISLGAMVLFWYACFHVTTRKPLGFGAYLAYIKSRLFMEGPILAPSDVEGVGDAELERTRWAGVKAIAVALLVRALDFQIRNLLLPADWDWRASSGLELLWFSYLNYISLSLTIVFSYNLPLGLMRLFGLPIRDNFAWWFLARTPNEHWRRWNLLFREWLVTFTFYPLMRARRPVFVAIMLTLIASGVLHIYGRLFGGPLTAGDVGLIMGYWILNGLAIYVVVDFPRRFPELTRRLGLGTSPAWSVAGWLATSAFYAALFTAHHECRSLAEAAAYFARLAGIAP